MYALPISDSQAIAVDDADEDKWIVHVVDFSARSLNSFPVEGLGHVQSLHYDTGRQLIWVIVDGTIFAIQMSEREIFEVRKRTRRSSSTRWWAKAPMSTLAASIRTSGAWPCRPWNGSRC